MTDEPDSILDRAEGVARRVLERLGAKLDRKIQGESRESLGPREVADLAARIEQTVDSALRADEKGIKRIAPDTFTVMLTYESAAEISEQYLEALSQELRVATQEYINDRRYETGRPVQLQVRRDLFTKATTINATFESDAAEHDSRSNAVSNVVPARPVAARRTLGLRIEGRSSAVVLNVNEAPKTIGRAAVGNAIRIDDESVSRMHCSIALKQSGEIVISDLGSANGTAVSGVRLRANEARQLHAGDEIVIGDVRVRVEVID